MTKTLDTDLFDADSMVEDEPVEMESVNTMPAYGSKELNDYIMEQFEAR